MFFYTVSSKPYNLKYFRQNLTKVTLNKLVHMQKLTGQEIIDSNKSDISCPTNTCISTRIKIFQIANIQCSTLFFVKRFWWLQPLSNEISRFWYVLVTYIKNIVEITYKKTLKKLTYIILADNFSKIWFEFNHLLF